MMPGLTQFTVMPVPREVFGQADRHRRQRSLRRVVLGYPVARAGWRRPSTRRRRGAIHLPPLRLRRLVPRRVRLDGRRHPPGDRIPEYYAAKGALPSIAVSLAKHLAGTGITVNCVSPGDHRHRRGRRALHRTGAPRRDRHRLAECGAPDPRHRMANPSGRVPRRPTTSAASSPSWWASPAGTSTAPTSATTAALPMPSPDRRTVSTVSCLHGRLLTRPGSYGARARRRRAHS